MNDCQPPVGTDQLPVPGPVSASRRSVLAGGVLAGVLALIPGARAGAATKKTTRKTTKKVTKAAAAPATTAAPAGPAGSATQFDASQELVISVTYKVQQAGFMVKNPYIVAFIVDANGALVRTVGMTAQINGRGQRYLEHLSEWMTLDMARISAGGADNLSTISSATRLPSTWKWAWDGRDDKKNLVPKGDYLVVIEGAREKNFYSVIHEPIRIDGTPFVQKPADSGELVAASVELRAR